LTTSDQPSPAKPRARRPRVTATRSTISEHPDRARIERDLALGRPLQRLARKYNVSKDALWRFKKHLPPQLKQALTAHALAPEQDLEALRTTESEGLLGHLAAQRCRRSQDKIPLTETRSRYTAAFDNTRAVAAYQAYQARLSWPRRSSGSTWASIATSRNY
jgi:hypothetical protein